VTGLRERKKAQTRAAIQRHALRLFRKQGYENTTVQQIAAAADVSESTFFRYFPTKEDVVLWDEFDTLILERLREQPPGGDPIQGLHAALRATFTELPPAEQKQLRERIDLLLSAPPLRALLMDELERAIGVLAQALAERLDRDANDPGVRAAAGAVIGVWLSVLFAIKDNPKTDLGSLIDDALVGLDIGVGQLSGRRSKR
jgi:AcrR family transcriptional regulator